ncbi:MAG: hypothetical protein IKT34_00500 [Clostridia bacterium]|nr:hypothetical protein [Clostridia bacterium]
MKKKLDKYFGNNVGRKVYIASLAVIAVGFAVGALYWWGYGLPIAAVGVLGFFISSGIQVSDKDIDEQVSASVSEYNSRLDGMTFNKNTLDARDFSYFYGFIREDNETRFNSGTDGRLRTSKYFVTAISENGKALTIFTTVYDLMTGKTVHDGAITTSGAIKTDFSFVETDFPKGNKKCTLDVYSSRDEKSTLLFFVPNDALADKFIAKLG